MFAVIRDVQNRFLFPFRFGSIFEKKTRIRFGLSWFGSVQKKSFGLDIIVSYYSCNSCVVNLQQILQ